MTEDFHEFGHSHEFYKPSPMSSQYFQIIYLHQDHIYSKQMMQKICNGLGCGLNSSVVQLPMNCLRTILVL